MDTGLQQLWVVRTYTVRDLEPKVKSKWHERRIEAYRCVINCDRFSVNGCKIDRALVEKRRQLCCISGEPWRIFELKSNFFTGVRKAYLLIGLSAMEMNICNVVDPCWKKKAPVSCL